MDKRIFAVTPLALAAAFFASVFCVNVAAPLRASPSLPEGVVLSLKAPSPYSLAQKVVAIARQIEPGPQTEALPFLLGAALGDPTLQGIDRDENVSLFLLTTEDAVAPVLLLKLAGNGPYRQSLPQLGFELSDHDGWTFATLQAMPFTIAEERRDLLLSLAQASRDRDIELNISGRELGARLLAIAENGDEFLQPFMGETNGAASNAIGSLARMLAEELLDVVSMGISMNLNADAIAPFAHLEGVAGSPLGNFLSHEVPVSTQLAEWIEADKASWVYLNNIDPEALGAYTRHLFSRLEEGFLKPMGEEGVTVGRVVRDLMDTYLENTGASSAGSLAPFGASDDFRVESFQLSQTRMSSDDLVNFLREAVALGQRESVTAFLKGMGQGHITVGAEDAVYLVEAERMVGDVPVHALHTGIVADEGEPSDDEKIEIAYFAVLEGLLLQSTSIDLLIAHIEAIASGEKPAANAAGEFAEKPGAASQFFVDAVPFFRKMEEDGLAPEGSVSGLDLPKIRGELLFENNTAVLRANMPVKLLAELYRHIKTLSVEERD
ncbi:MAG: hypothetical protein WD490_02635 [Opitutales bacterium]